jgi:hypothetical protein
MEMPMTLTPDQRRRIESGQAVRIEDPETHRAYVVLAEDAYHRMRDMAEYDSDDMTQAEQDGLLREFGLRAGWDDPTMDVCDENGPGMTGRLGRP